MIYKKGIISIRLVLVVLGATILHSSMNGQQSERAFTIKKIYNEALSNNDSYVWLDHLSEKIGGRLAASEASLRAVEYTKQLMERLKMDEVILQPCEVPAWQRIGPEVVRVSTKILEGISLSATTLGNSTGGIAKGHVIEVQSLEEVDSLGREVIEGKIVFYNRPMDPKKFRTFHAYGGAVDQRTRGPAIAARNGAIGAIVRSMTTQLDDVPHTGVTLFRENELQIPAMAISTVAAEQLSSLLSRTEVELYMENHSTMNEPQPSFNVIGEIRGSENPDEIIAVGGHLDSWDIGGGAHDDGAGCVHALNAIRILKAIGYKPKRTIRCVMFMNEENGLSGGLAYAKASNQKGEYHMAALESDSGGFSPRVFSCDAEDAVFTGFFQVVSSWSSLLEPYGLMLSKGGSGADISPLKGQKGLLMGLRTDSQRYFDFHHTAIDRIEAVNPRELALGGAALAAMIYLIDETGLK